MRSNRSLNQARASVDGNRNIAPRSMEIAPGRGARQPGAGASRLPVEAPFGSGGTAEPFPGVESAVRFWCGSGPARERMTLGSEPIGMAMAPMSAADASPTVTSQVPAAPLDPEERLEAASRPARAYGAAVAVYTSSQVRKFSFHRKERAKQGQLGIFSSKRESAHIFSSQELLARSWYPRHGVIVSIDAVGEENRSYGRAAPTPLRRSSRLQDSRMCPLQFCGMYDRWPLVADRQRFSPQAMRQKDAKTRPAANHGRI